jgi:uncharacterized protein (TIGR02001 family)
MLKTKLLVIALGAVFALPAMAEDAPAAASPVTGNVGIVSDYVYRGLTQTSHNPAIQGGFDYAHSSGLYAGVWGSNVSWIADSGAVSVAAGNYGPTMELDTYFGFKGAIASVSYDVGAIRYNYLGSGYTPAVNFANADTAEAYVGLGYDIVSFKYSYGLLDRFLTTPNAGGTGYADLTVTYPVESLGVTVGAHAGHQHFNIGPTDTVSYSDYKLSVSKDFGGYVAGVAYTGTNVSPSWTYGNQDWGKSTVALSLTHAM